MDNKLNLPTVTVAVITRDRSDSLKRTLDSILRLNYPNFEVIVVDNASTDETKSVVASFDKIQYVYSPTKDGFSKTRQRAVQIANGEFIAWCDDDCIPDSDWIHAFVQRFLKDEKLALLGGYVINIDFPKMLQFKGRSKMSNNGVLKFLEDPHDAEFFGNLNMAFRTSMVHKVGGYDPFFVGGYEEIDLTMSLRKAGYLIAYEPEAIVRHYHNHVSFKKGRLFYGPQLMRIYFCIKHLRPTEFGDIFNFHLGEVKLFYRDLKFVLRTLISACLKKNRYKIRITLIELFNVITARLAIPWIFYKVIKRNNLVNN